MVSMVTYDIFKAIVTVRNKTEKLIKLIKPKNLYIYFCVTMPS